LSVADMQQEPCATSSSGSGSGSGGVSECGSSSGSGSVPEMSEKEKIRAKRLAAMNHR
jgi:hypothetical protein